MPSLPIDDENLPLFTVGQVAAMLEVQHAFLRRLDEFRVVRPSRSAGGQRRYTRPRSPSCIRRAAGRRGHDPGRHPPRARARSPGASWKRAGALRAALPSAIALGRGAAAEVAPGVPSPRRRDRLGSSCSRRIGFVPVSLDPPRSSVRDPRTSEPIARGRPAAARRPSADVAVHVFVLGRPRLGRGDPRAGRRRVHDALLQPGVAAGQDLRGPARRPPRRCCATAGRSSSSQRSRACAQNASASSSRSGRARCRSSAASSCARTQTALIANSSAPMSTIRPRKPCLRSSLPCQRAIP